ncbi:hypothetical protein QC761_503020 [Podospora bellae-mahoneyi]|uniref:DUF1479 domain protein n=1 Tax=Podospora bellae-mahoneyi TaxID=2093777 RepID=A0ABR0FEZ4_9PEZI|nr:hypothetical protein QC761_503020 [Podospora bellae-mahoneyi]
MASSASGAAVHVSTRASTTITASSPPKSTIHDVLGPTVAGPIMPATEPLPLALAGTGPAGNNPIGINDMGLEARARCNQCGRRRTTCHHPQRPQSPAPPVAPAVTLPPPTSPSFQLSSVNPITNGSLSAAYLPLFPHQQRPRRLSKLKHRNLTATFAAPLIKSDGPPPLTAADFLAASARSSSSSSSRPVPVSSTSNAMEPPVLSFYGKEPVPLPTRFAQIKRSLVEGHEAELEASWARLIEALRDEVDDIAQRGSHLTPSIDFADMDNAESRAVFSRDLKRYGLGLIRGVVPRTDAQVTIDETVKYLEKQTDFKEPTPQDPTCFDFFWTPAQVRTRAHPRVMAAQKFAMSLWDNNADDRMVTRFPIAYADRLRIHGANIGGVGPDAPAGKKKKAEDDSVANDSKSLTPDEEAQKAALELELLGDFASSTVIAQVDNGSLERWEPDGYGRGGTYQAVFNGEWEKYDPWDPTHRVSATSDLYNGYGACSVFRMYQGVVALSTIEPGLIRLLPSPKLATAYFLLRPFFSPKTKAPERRDGPEWEAFLDPSNWALDKEQSTIIHGAVPGHAQRLTELWHPHLHLRKTLVTIPTLQTGDYIVWHPDLAYHITSNPNVMASRAPTPPPMGDEDKPPSRPVSILVYVPAAPLTQNNALYLARQRKTFQRGHPSPDFDSTGSGLGSEATHIGRVGETEIAEIGGPAGLQAMGLAPFDVAPTPPADTNGGSPDADVEMDDSVAAAAAGKSNSVTRAEAEVARLANIILFPDRYDFYMAKRTGNTRKRSRDEAESESSPAPTSEVKREDKGKGKEQDTDAGR